MKMSYSHSGGTHQVVAVNKNVSNAKILWVRTIPLIPLAPRINAWKLLKKHKRFYENDEEEEKGKSTSDDDDANEELFG